VDSPEAIRAWPGSRRIDRSRGLHGRSGAEARAASAIIRAAFAGRTSTYDQQDPTLSLPRQLRASQAVLPEEAVIVAHFYDVESGRKELADRGHGHAHEQFQIPIPRDGGLADLLEEAERPGRRFDVVICESIDRIARRTYIATEIEHRLEQAGVCLIAADEPITLTTGRRQAKTATQVLTRRVKQGVAEWYVLDLLEKSWGGFEIHTEAGFNIGKPCYGYRAKKVPHPVPAKRAKGIKKTRLEADPIQGAVVRKAFGWRVVEHLGYQAIAERLNADLTANPPPTPVDPAAAAGLWTYSNVRDVLTNPKHTGHMVWNRRARKGSGKNRMNPVSEWVWSAEPVHEALVDLETFVQAQRVADRRERSRTAAGLNPGPQAKHVYRLRSYLFCCSCGRRMFGNTKRQVSWYACAPKKAYRPGGHPVIFRVREDHLLGGLAGFLSERVFGPYRHHLLAAELKTASEAARQERASRISALRRSIAETETKSKRLIRHLELADGIDQDFIRDINERRAELRARRDELQRQLAAAEDQAHQAPNPALLDQLPVTPVDLASMPDEVSRRLFEALRLQIHYDFTTHIATCTITLTADTIDAVARTSQETIADRPAEHATGHHQADGGRAAQSPHGDGLCCAPSRIRTYAHGSGGRCSLP
jgi:site-specific DNA recombinase